MAKKSKRSKRSKQRKQRKANLGQKEAGRQQRSEFKLSHMGSSSRSNKRTANRLRKFERYHEG
jgi:hypothetical protein